MVAPRLPSQTPRLAKDYALVAALVVSLGGGRRWGLRGLVAVPARASFFAVTCRTGGSSHAQACLQIRDLAAVPARRSHATQRCLSHAQSAVRAQGRRRGCVEVVRALIPLSRMRHAWIPQRAIATPWGR